MSQTIYFEDRQTEKTFRAEVRNQAFLEVLKDIEEVRVFDQDWGPNGEWYIDDVEGLTAKIQARIDKGAN